MTMAHETGAAPQMPENIDAEQAMLGAIMVNNEAATHVADFLRPEHFAEPVHGRIYRAALSLIDAGQLANPVTLKQYFDGDPALAEVGGARYLARLAGAAITVINCEHYARTIRDLAQRRRIIEACEHAAARARDADIDEPPPAILEDLETDLYGLRDGERRRRTMRIGTALDLALEQAQEARENKRAVGVTTGLLDLDQRIGGLPLASLIVMGGRPSMGKTALALAMARAAAEDGEGVGFFSYEQPAEHLALRIAADVAWAPGHAVAYSDVLTGEADEDQMARIAVARARVARMPIEISDSVPPTVAAMRSEANRMARRFEAEGRRLGLIIADYLQLMRASRAVRNENRNAQLSEITQDLKQLARDFNAPLVLLSQLSRDVEKRDNKRPLLSDLRDSGSIEQDADIVLFPFRQAYYDQRRYEATKSMSALADYDESQHKMEIIPAKNRNGPTAAVEIYCDIGANVFRNKEFAHA